MRTLWKIYPFVLFLFDSLIELFYRTGAGLSVLRTFRLLRILKLVRFLPALRQQLVIMLKTMDNVATFFALLCLFIFIFRSAADVFCVCVCVCSGSGCSLVAGRWRCLFSVILPKT